MPHPVSKEVFEELMKAKWLRHGGPSQEEQGFGVGVRTAFARMLYRDDEPVHMEFLEGFFEGFKQACDLYMELQDSPDPRLAADRMIREQS